ncbi:putative choline transporter, neither null mutation nor overexpression affects choline transport [Podila clonocystis]|nr:putative choline transporter, neither null mutation nor overexpression affects choline transport [Podila clonocystis]
MFDRHSRSLQRTLGFTSTSQAKPPLSMQPPPEPPVSDVNEQPPAYQESPAYGLHARPAHQADPEDDDSVPDKGPKRSWSLYVFIMQMVVSVALTIVAILGIFNRPLPSPDERNFPYYSSSLGNVAATSVVGMEFSAGFALFMLSFLSLPNLGSVTTAFNVVILVSFGVGALIATTKFAVGMGLILLGAIFLGVRIFFNTRIVSTKILLTTVMANKSMSNNVFIIALAGLFAQVVYSVTFSIVVTGYGPSTASAYAPLPYILIVFSYLSYLWTSQVITNVVYATTVGVAAIHYLPHGPHGQDTLLTVLKRVVTTSFGPICYGSSTFIRSVFMCLYVCYPVVKPLAVKYAFYHVVVHGLDFRKASKKVRAQFGTLKEKKTLDTLMLERLLLVTALLVALLSGGVYWSKNEVPNVHIVVAAVLASVQMVLTAGAAADAVVDTMFVVLAEDPEGFVASHEELVGKILRLSGGNPVGVELQAVEVDVRGAA